jgi:hypothetical protein
MPFKPSLCLALLFLGIFFALTMGSMPAGISPAHRPTLMNTGRTTWMLRKAHRQPNQCRSRRVRCKWRATVIANLDAL